MIDAGVFIGRNPTNGNELSLNDYLTRMDDISFEYAIVSHYKSIYLNYKEGNEELLKLAREQSSIIPSVIVSPNGFDMNQDPDYLKELYRQGARVLGVYLYPKYYDIQLESRLLRNIVKTASQIGFRIQFGLQSVNDLYKVLDYYSDISTPVLIRWMAGRGYNNLAEIINASRIMPQLLFDVGSIANSGGIRYLVDAIGAEKLFYTSNSPESFTESSMFLLQAADLTEDEKKQIYYKTLSKVFELKSNFEEKFQSFQSSWQDKMGEYLNRPKVDTHYHINNWNLIEPEADVEFCLKEFKKFNYQKVVISPIKALNYSMEEGNSETLKLIDSHPNIYGLIVIDPLRVEDSCKQIDLLAKHKKIVGLKTIQDLYGYGLDHPSYLKIFDYSQKYKLSVMAHIPGMLEAAKKFTQLNFVCAHSTWERVKHMENQKNIYFDLATSHNDFAETKMKLFIDKMGEDHLIFASDGQLINPAWTIGKLASSGLSENQLNLIFNKNAYEAFPKLKENE